MKINKSSVSSSSYVASAGKAYGQNKKVESKGPVQQKDSVEVSGTGSLFQTASEALTNVPDIRTEAVAPIQKEFDEGSYHRDEQEVAEKIVDDHIKTPVP